MAPMAITTPRSTTNTISTAVDGINKLNKVVTAESNGANGFRLPAYREYTDVIVSEIPDSMAVNPEGLCGVIDIAKARRQHAAYVAALKATGVNVTVLPANEEFPDCVFVEDVATIVGSTALVTKPGVDSRRWETERIKPVLKAAGLTVMEVLDEEATIDGGDVIFTGHEILVGQSKRTNRKGFEAVVEAFPGMTVVPVPVSGPLHLTTLIGVCGEDTLCVADESGDSMAMFLRIQANSERTYKAVVVPDDLAANCILMNGKLLCKSAAEHPKSNAVISEKVDFPLLPLELSEIEKAVGSLTCMSLRFNKPRRVGPANM